ncbi:MAG: folate-binding protein YgfZ [Congregibacter sp.]
MSVFACALPEETMLHLRGGAIPAFLQGQLSCDTRKLSTTQAVPGALCNVKGRVISDVMVVQVSDSHCLLRLRRSMADRCREVLSRYAQFSRIAVETAAAGDRIVGIYTMHPDQQLGEAVIPEGANPFSVSIEEDALILHRSPTQLEIIMFGDVQRAQNMLRRFAIEEGSAADWDYAVLRAGHYAINPDDSEVYTPQALNYDLSGRVAFDKGCYTGQEVIARLHYKGRSKRRLQIYTPQPTSDGDNAVLSTQPEGALPGAQLYLSDGTAVGTLLRCERHSSGALAFAAEVLEEHREAPLTLESGTIFEPEMCAPKAAPEAKP